MVNDGRSAPGVDRLTAAEKDCLRRRLQAQTAKEMALDLGISPHAVEKRLKMARAKLGVSSSLQAARLLADAEGYQVLVPQTPDLPRPIADGDDDVATSPLNVPLRHLSLFKGLSMIALASLIIVAAQHAIKPTDATSPPMMENGHPIATRKVGMHEASIFLRQAFSSFDADHSGALDPQEASALEPRDANRDKTLPPAPPAADPAAAAKWMAKLDTNRDGRVSEAEYVSYMMPWTLLTGVPAGWHPPK